MTPALWCSLATVGPVGRMRPAPGTWGSLFSLVTGFGLASLSPRLLEVATLLVIVLGTIAANHHQNETLAELRDTLLPKLMSGEIRVKDAESEMEAAV